MKVVHVAPLHRRTDVRVFLKECVSLARSGTTTSCIVADGQGDETLDSIRVVDCGAPPKGKFGKRLVPLFRSAQLARREAPDLIHFHDGMFLPFAILLALTGHRVVYDVHEDYREQVLNTRFPVSAKRAASLLYAVLEWLGSRVFTAIVAATPHIATLFPPEKTITVQNFPLSDELVLEQGTSYVERPPAFAYLGGISAMRGIEQMISGLHKVAYREPSLELMGSFNPEALQAKMEELPGWKQVNFHGWMGRKHAASILGSCRAGLVLYLPGPNHLEAQPNKLFEYMAAELPVIASDFPLWRRIVEGAGCGLLVDPLDPNAIAQAMSWILDHPEEAAAMGERGRKAVIESYNWEREAEKLVALYRFLEHS